MLQTLRALLCACAALLAIDALAARQALVIGNDSYTHVAPLRNARADAKAMARALEGAGFKVTLRIDLTEKQMTRALREFKNTIAGGDEAVFFYAGHGVQIGGANYLLPVDLQGEDEGQVRDDAVSLQRVLDDLQEQKARFTLAIVDACRDNPFKAGRNIGTRGLAPTSAADGQMVIFAAGAGQKALDQVGPNDRSPNGLFTRVFVKEIEKPGVPVHDALRNVRDEVVRQARTVNHQQVPAIYDQSVGKFFFRPGSTQVAAATAATPLQPVVPVAEAELWGAVQAGNTVEDYEAYLARYPEGANAAEAKARIETQRAAAAAKAERDAWARADRGGTIEGYRAYLQAYPQGTYASLALMRARRLEAVQAAAPPSTTREVAKGPAGGAPIGDRYQVSADGLTVRDLRTGLVWQRCLIGQKWDGRTCTGRPLDLGNDRVAQHARSYAGFDDWRVPDRNELMSLVQCSNGATTPLQPMRSCGTGHAGAAINAAVFPGPTAWTWSSQSSSHMTVWAVDFSTGEAQTQRSDMTFHGRLVRVGEAAPSPADPAKAAAAVSTKIGDRFLVAADGLTVKDLWSGLLWQRCLVGQKWNGNACVGRAVDVNGLHAASYAKPYAGFDDWRVPDRGELMSLVRCTNGVRPPLPLSRGCGAGHSGPALDPQAFPGPASWTWTSQIGPNLGWAVNFADGEAQVHRNDTTFHARLVRKE